MIWTEYARRMMPAKLALESCQLSSRFYGRCEWPYKMPAVKTADTLSFFWTGSFRCQMVQRGRSKIKTSDRTLIVPVTMRLMLVSTQAPVIDAFHALGTGTHWKMTDSTLAV